MADAINNERFRKLLFSFPGKAIHLIHEEYYSSLIRISERLTHSRDAAEDIVQEAFIYVWQNHEWLGQEHEKSIEHYLVRIVRNRSITYYTNDMKLKVSRTKYINGHTFDKIEHSAEANTIAQEMREEFRRLILDFPLRERQCYLMSLEDEMTNKQIAERLNISVKAVERSITSANKRLKKHWLGTK